MTFLEILSCNSVFRNGIVVIQIFEWRLSEKKHFVARIFFRILSLFFSNRFSETGLSAPVNKLKKIKKWESFLLTIYWPRFDPCRFVISKNIVFLKFDILKSNMIFAEVVMLGFIEMSLFRFFTQSLPRNCPMWGTTTKI